MKVLTLSIGRAAVLGIALLSLAGCGDDHRAAGIANLEPTGVAPTGAACSTPSEGCPCSGEVRELACGVTIKREGDVLTCREGMRTCVDGSWTACVGDATIEMQASRATRPGIKTLGLAASPQSCLDECNPLCRRLADTPDDLTVPTGLVADPSGLTLYTDGYTGSTCPDLAVSPASATLTITQINADGTVQPSSVELEALCGAANKPVVPSWSTDQPDRSWVEVDGTLQVFSAVAGDINVTASSLLSSSSAVVTVAVDVNEVAGISTAVQTAFDGAGTATDPGRTLYPYRNTVFPLDLKAPLVQWSTGGTAAANVQVALRYPAGSASPSFWYSKIFAGEPNEGTVQPTGAPSWQIPQAVWAALGRTAQGDDAEIIIQRKTAGTTYGELIIPVRFATAALRGTVYYTQYLRRLSAPGTTDQCTGQPDLPATYDPLNPGATLCPVGNCTHPNVANGSMTRAIDLSSPTAANTDPFAPATGGCPVCHSVSAQGNRYVAGSKFLQDMNSGTSTGYVADIAVDASGTSYFSTVGEASNYASFRTATDWNSRGFAYAALTPDGALALQGPRFWGNTLDGTVTNNLSVDKSSSAGGKIEPMFFVPTTVTGTSVLYATTASLSATRSGNVLTASAGGVLPTIDGATLALGDSVLVKNQSNKVDNGIYVVSNLGTAPVASADLTTSTSLGMTASSSVQTPANAIDNNTNSRWESLASDPQWLRVDLGSIKTINRVRIDWDTANAKDYTVAVSTDGVAWTTIATQTNMATGNHRIDDLTGSVSGRYVRVNGTARNTLNGYSIYEIDVYGPTSGTPYSLTRRTDAQSPATADGQMLQNWEVRVTRGTSNYSKVFRLTSPATTPTINTSQLTFSDIGASALPVMMTPTISPDGTKIAYVNGNQDTIGADSTAWRKGLTLLSLDQSSRVVSNKKRVLNNWDAATGGKPVNWPFFEPDSRSLIFVESTTDSYCRSEGTATADGRACREAVYGNTSPTTRGYWPGSIQSIDTGAANPAGTKVALAKLNKTEDASVIDQAYQPTVLPFASGGYRWVIFTSPRAYGNQFNQLGTDFTCGASMLWISALDDVTADGSDRSHPAFFLPGQNVAPITGDHYVNERGYLVPSPCKANGVSCSTTDECCGASECRVDTIGADGIPSKVCKDPSACSVEGGACLTSADCCGGSPCVAQKCEKIPTYPGAFTFTRDFVAECDPGYKPRWGLLSVHATTPSDSRLGLAAQTAEVAADLDAAPFVDLGDSTLDTFGITADWRDVGDELERDDQPFALSYLRISITLYPSSDGLYAPTVHDWDQVYTCMPAE